MHTLLLAASGACASVFAIDKYVAHSRSPTSLQTLVFGALVVELLDFFTTHTHTRSSHRRGVLSATMRTRGSYYITICNLLLNEQRWLKSNLRGPVSTQIGIVTHPDLHIQYSELFPRYCSVPRVPCAYIETPRTDGSEHKEILRAGAWGYGRHMSAFTSDDMLAIGEPLHT